MTVNRPMARICPGGAHMEMEGTFETVSVDGRTTAVSPDRCVIVLDRHLPIGQAANAAAVIVVTIRQRHPVLIGEQLVDASGFLRAGLIPIGIAVLAASSEDLRDRSRIDWRKKRNRQNRRTPSVAEIRTSSVHGTLSMPEMPPFPCPTHWPGCGGPGRSTVRSLTQSEIRCIYILLWTD
jgi:hypothetical protein